MSKGSWRRRTNEDKFGEAYDRIFRKNEKEGSNSGWVSRETNRVSRMEDNSSTAVDSKVSQHDSKPEEGPRQ